MKIYTIGHSTLTFDDFYITLQAFRIEKLIDVRSHPGSRYVPHFNKEILTIELPKKQIEYMHMPKLGGRRRSYCQQDYNFVDGWKNKSFKNYASYTLTDEYKEGIRELMAQAKEKIVCIMCAEVVPWKCHRLIISNTLTYNNCKVFHIMNEKQATIHKLNQYGAKVCYKDGQIIYPQI